MRSLALVAALLWIGVPARAVDELVTLEQGQLQGIEVDGIIAWHSIPYARPPVGALRFAEAQDPVPWEGVRDATSGTSIACTQPGFGGEDCLVLTVTAAADAEDAPVLVYIHGGGMVGQARGSTADRPRVEQYDAVIVSINYRLGALAAYASPALRLEHPAGSAGNNSLLDAIAALRWVHENIAAFGGDPDRITLQGHSAGASLIAYMLASPLTQGMIWQAWLASPAYADRLPSIDGSNGSSDFLLNALERGAEIEAAAGCDTGSSAERLTCMRALEPHEVVAAGLTREHVLATDLPETWPNVDGYALWFQPGLAMRWFSKDVRIVGGSTRHDIATWWINEPIPDQAALEALINARFHPYWAGQLIPLYPAAAFAGDGPAGWTPAKSAWMALVTDVAFGCATDGFLKAAASAEGRTAEVRAYTFEREHPVYGAFHSMDEDFWFGVLGTGFQYLIAWTGYTPTYWDPFVQAAMRDEQTRFIKGQAFHSWWPALGASTLVIPHGEMLTFGTHEDGRGGRCDDLREMMLLL